MKEVEYRRRELRSFSVGRWQAGKLHRFSHSYFSAPKGILNSNSFVGQTLSQFVSIKKPFETSFHRPRPVTFYLFAFNIITKSFLFTRHYSYNKLRRCSTSERSCLRPVLSLSWIRSGIEIVDSFLVQLFKNCLII